MEGTPLAPFVASTWLHSLRYTEASNDRLSTILPGVGTVRRRQHAGEMAFLHRSLNIIEAPLIDSL